MVWLDEAARDLAEKGWFIRESAVGPELVSIVNEWMDVRVACGDLKDAAIGKGGRLSTNNAIRGDLIYWLPDESGDAVIQSLNSLTEAIRNSLNRDLFAGLESFEGHVAIYPPGSFYRKHIDTFRDDDTRKVTFLLYLNEAWKPEDGGCLRLYLTDHEHLDIEPKAGTVVMFNSRDFAHEVLEASSHRRSFTGWFKVRSLGR